MDLHGRFIVVDGPDGAGKGTQIEHLKRLVESLGGQWVVAKDPGGTEIGDRIRHVLLGYDLSQMAPRCETLLFMASRAQLVHEVVEPALRAGKTVLGDRFISATCAYQVAAGFPRDEVIQLGHLAVGDTWPDLTLVLDVPPELGFERTGRTPQRIAARKRTREKNHDQMPMFNDSRHDAMEARSLEFHRRVRELFRELPQVYPRPAVVIDATRDADTVFADVQEALRRVFP